ncbi:hypothetical protein PAPYR_7669 [Paratrimastix pyriformis]|uniref:Uncharacterized protein n=1 Tax=Paratrimastix pyriformis TaxID=342808 RepID=A0ABQ8UGX4_9EUKA|nr:hypothetical protein PAPYR_7669 [Paratrimastix pyriformis]
MQPPPGPHSAAPQGGDDHASIHSHHSSQTARQSLARASSVLGASISSGGLSRIGAKPRALAAANLKLRSKQAVPNEGADQTLNEFFVQHDTFYKECHQKFVEQTNSIDASLRTVQTQLQGCLSKRDDIARSIADLESSLQQVQGEMSAKT